MNTNFLNKSIFLAASIFSANAFAGPTGPDGQGVNYSQAKRITIPAGQALRIAVNYSADKEVHARIWLSDEDRSLRTRSNRSQVYTTPERSRNQELIITGWSKNCWAGSRRCPGRGWVQEPYHVFSTGRVIGFEDTYNGPYRAGTYDDVQVTITCLNNRVSCPVN